jgi:asparagine synthase (glutamine-hydrolysing)
MCGLIGFLTTDTGRFGDLDSVVTSMALAIQHRGPDDARDWTDTQAGIALGHRRLSIVDLSPAGHQPMMCPCGRYVVAFNGEIYNHLEMRAELELFVGRVAWRGHSDTETLLACIKAWGVKKP